MKLPMLNWKRWPFALLGLLLGAAPAVAHEKWFVDEHAYRGAIPEVFTSLSFFGVTALAVGVALFLLVLVVDRAFDGSDMSRWFDEWFESRRLKPQVMLAVTLGVSLMGAGLQRLLFAPGLPLPEGGFFTFLALAQTIVGVGLLFMEPYYAELGAGIVVLWLLGLFGGLPIQAMLEELLILGAGIYFMAGETERAPWSHWNTEEVRRRGYQAFRILVGVNFLALASVKWLRPDLAIHLVSEHHINFMGALGMTDAQFVFCAAIVETVIALCILFRAAFRLACLMAFNAFLITIYVFGFKELLGHLPIKAALFLFIVNGHWHKGEVKPLG